MNTIISCASFAYVYMYMYVCVYDDNVVDKPGCSLKQKEVVEKLLGYIVDDDGEKGGPEPATSTETAESSSEATTSASEAASATETMSAGGSESADATPSTYSSGDDDATSSGEQDTSRQFKYVFVFVEVREGERLCVHASVLCVCVL